jgi:HlyD family secretion protein
MKRATSLQLYLGSFCWLAVLSGCGRTPVAEMELVDREDHRVEVAVTTVQRSAIDDTVQLVGTLLPWRRTVIVSEVDGVIQKIPAITDAPAVEIEGREIAIPLDMGAEVSKDDLLCQLDATDFQLSLEVAEARWQAANKDLENLLAWQRPEEVLQAKARLEEAQAVYKRAESEFERIVKLRQQGSISNSEYDDKVALASQAKAMLDQAEATYNIAMEGPTEEQVAVARAAVATAEAQVRQAQWKVERTTITAPYDAVITDRYVDLGDRVTAMPRVEIMEIAAVDLLLAEVGVPERYVQNVKLEDPAQILADGYSEPFPGRVVMINGKVDPANRMFRVRIAIDNQQRRLRVGQFVRVQLRLQTEPDTITIPRAALTYAGGQPQVFVLADDVVALRRVELGIQAEDRVQVVSGLQGGETIVVDDPAVLADGMPVRISPADAGDSARRLAS